MRDYEIKKALTTDIGEYCTVISWQDLSDDKYAADNTGRDPRTAKCGDRLVRIGPRPGPNHSVRGSLNTGKLVWSTTTDNYCVAQFFIYHALDINK